MAKVVILGAGPMGLAAAWQAAVDGHQVELLEAAPVAGGMAAHFDFDGLSIERFYHFVCRADEPTFQAMRDLGIWDKMRWVPTTMGFFFGGRLNPWGDPVSLLRLPGASLLTKLRYGLFAFVSTRRSTWPALENQSAKEWIQRWCGLDGYEKFWRPLFDFKFYQYADNVSAAWIWTRIHRIGGSRRSMMQEELGYIEGGSQTLVDALVEQFERHGGKIRLNAAAQEVTVENGSVSGVRTPTGEYPAEYVISTMPVQVVPEVVPALSAARKQQYRDIHNIGICCVIFKLRKPVSKHFWININDRAHEIPGIIEFSNLRKTQDSIVYVPYYMPVTDPKFGWSDAELEQDAFACLQQINPALTRGDLIAATTSRLRHAQPICDVGFAAKIPPVQTEIAGLQVADTCFYYPEDRGISESIRLGREMARAIPHV